MKISILLNVILAIALVALVVHVAFLKPKSSVAPLAATTEDAVLHNIMTRTSIRAYQDKDVEAEKVEKMLQAAMAAPTAGNKQPWRFVVIKDTNTLAAISEKFNTMKMAVKAPMAIVVCGNLDETFKGEGVNYWVQDASAATENLLLAAHSMGLGAVWCGIAPLTERIEALKALLLMPDHIVPLNVVVVGYPAETPAPKDKWKPERIYYEVYGRSAAEPNAAE